MLLIIQLLVLNLLIGTLLVSLMRSELIPNDPIEIIWVMHLIVFWIPILILLLFVHIINVSLKARGIQ